MGRKKKKMTPAQAAAARWEVDEPQEPQTNIDPNDLGHSTVVVDKGKLAQFIWPVILVAVVALVAYIMSGIG